MEIKRTTYEINNLISALERKGDRIRANWGINVPQAIIELAAARDYGRAPESGWVRRWLSGAEHGIPEVDE